ncbi:hypothetical protein [Jannaschia formosa]|uniref:hypothetical protein n=1 Tax=Jannaschia formosa TaxID=2259592 RepID=UPI0010753F20|nr:hypothetical protein [Jannaschia formosa]TFL16043.1 hypothetical protein DR046_22105 [Jannaschia formosa]
MISLKGLAAQIFGSRTPGTPQSYHDKVGDAPVALPVPARKAVIDNAAMFLDRKTHIDHIFEALDDFRSQGSKKPLLVLTTACYRDGLSVIYERVSQFEAYRRHQWRVQELSHISEVDWTVDNGKALIAKLKEELWARGLHEEGSAQHGTEHFMITRTKLMTHRQFPTEKKCEELRHSLQTFADQHARLVLPSGHILITFVEFEGEELSNNETCRIVKLLEDLKGDAHVILDRPPLIYSHDIVSWAEDVVNLMRISRHETKRADVFSSLRSALANYYDEKLMLGAYFHDVQSSVTRHAREEYQHWRETEAA